MEIDADFYVSVDQSQILSKSSPAISTPNMNDSATNTDEVLAPPPSSEPYFITPPGLRPNTFFVGMQKEFKDLDEWLLYPRQKGATGCVLLHGPPGGGKSHLARQYVFEDKNKQKFPGGIFWITSRSREEMRHAFWDILQKVVLKESPNMAASTLRRDFVSTVKAWFESRQEWLIVFDGVAVDRDEEVTELTTFVPYSENSSIIFVSRQNNLTSRERLRRPHAIKVGPLKDDDAKTLLFEVLNKKKPSEAEQRKATELVRKIGGLPLIIVAISHRLADTHEPLTKYKLSFSSDPAVEGTYNQILDDLLRLGHNAAWSLFCILCWFGQSIPVEMVHLGIKILRRDNIDVKSAENGGKPDLNTTFSILMRYALIERNEPESDSGSMNSSHDSLSEPIDMLKIHGVVQTFCCESLRKRGMLKPWLGYAIKIFTYSYHQADIRIKRKPEPGRVSDYRFYLVHGQILWNHTEQYGGRKRALAGLQQLLKPFLNMIHDEIQIREPSSSQESLRQGVFQASIFDRTSSSSSSGLQGPPTPDDRPTPPPLPITTFGYALDKEPTDSPQSLGATSPLIRELANSPHRSLTLEDAGYDSDREGASHGQDMRPSLSEATVRPHSRMRTDTTDSQQSGWQIVPPARRPPNRRRHRDLGNFRPVHASVSASAQIDRTNASVSAHNENKRPHRRESSPAFKALEQVQSRTPSPPISSRVASFFQRRFSGPSSKPDQSQQLTWAKVAAGNIGLTKNSTTTGSLVGRAEAASLDRGRSYEKRQSRQGHVQSGSPLASAFVLQHQQQTGSDDRQSHDQSSYEHALADSRPSSSGRKNHPSELIGSGLYDSPPVRYVTNPNPLIIERNISIKMPEFQRSKNDDRFFAQAYSDYGQRDLSPSYQESSFPVPSGYYSQPVSRDHSHQSHPSLAETEPLHQGPTFSPRIGPQTGRTPMSAPSSSYYFSGSTSPRERRADGRAYRKSPRTEYTVPAIPFSRQTPQIPTPRQPYTVYPTPATTTTALHMNSNAPSFVHDPLAPRTSPLQQPAAPYPSPQPQPPHSLPQPHYRSSRASSTGSHTTARPNLKPGPGIAITDPFTGRPTNIIVGFESHAQLPPSPSPVYASFPSAAAPPTPALLPPPPTQVQFGAHAPIDLMEAQRRTIEAEERLRAEALERERTRLSLGRSGMAKAYPDINLIPTASERSMSDGSAGGGALDEMVASAGGGTQSGYGLGLEFEDGQQRYR